MTSLRIKKIVSGGQTGVDRAALDVAITLEVPHGGWCPKGRKAEDGKIADRYQLKETPTDVYDERTTWNVRDSDGTLIIIKEPAMGGTLLTIEVAKQFNKPYLVYDLSAKPDIDKIVDWINENAIQTLNVAGPRQSQSENIYQIAYDIMQQLLAHPQLQEFTGLRARL
ncbi:MAG: putative molybdenum carrier protein [Coxiellaceae bacterium]|nr:MAG: putative molybdenum carrier protein [Coxiellaceae bacterium]